MHKLFLCAGLITALSSCNWLYPKTPLKNHSLADPCANGYFECRRHLGITGPVSTATSKALSRHVERSHRYAVKKKYGY